MAAGDDGVSAREDPWGPLALEDRQFREVAGGRFWRGRIRERQAEDAEAAYNQALADARAEALDIAAQARAEIQADLDEAIARADAEIAEKAGESEARIGEIQASALASVEEVARDTAGEIVSALGGSANADAISAAVTSSVRGDAS